MTLNYIEYLMSKLAAAKTDEDREAAFEHLERIGIIRSVAMEYVKRFGEMIFCE